MRIITLGTGAGRPTAQRLTSASALEYEGEVLLFDCGEGVQLQLIRSPLHWGKMRAIFIGHLHGDHLYGLPGLLGTLSLMDRSEPLRLFGPPGLKEYLEVQRKIHSLWIRFPLEIQEIHEAGVLWTTENYSVSAAPLEHTITCWGYVFQEKPRAGRFDAAKAEALGIPDGPLRGRLVQGETVDLPDGRRISPETLVGPRRPGRRVAYCLDTRPCRGARELAEGADLVLHEATFGCDMQSDATQWGHSTAADAGRLAREAGAKRLILTHISQRYMEAQVLLDEAQREFAATELASDLAQFFLS
ncbi:MAG TPA: ribonuclease Z [Deltaproteobacteria bacterium]|nr:ribonuclease Z [Deltaproteobacteria bacterium]